jgi:uncharacterized protein YciI
MSDNTQFLYRIQPTRPEMLVEGLTEAESRITAEHFQYLSGLKEQGIVILAGRTLNTDPTSFGIVILNAETEAAAREIMNNDPAVAQGVMSAMLFPYRVALIAEGNIQNG